MENTDNFEIVNSYGVKNFSQAGLKEIVDGPMKTMRPKLEKHFNQEELKEEKPDGNH